MGSNEELGVVLMKSFIFALTKQDQLPKEMIFYNEGIFLTTNEGDILNDLKCAFSHNFSNFSICDMLGSIDERNHYV